ncbi:Fanconi anemia group I protein homolog [Planococcus citri]|uniref:Fanconi anemia group I protein homolog n=1 Tax=Planococcus citri TaxID=170843 RepID=UPI0031F7EF4B
MDDAKYEQLLDFAQRTYKTDAEIQPLQQFMEENVEIVEIVDTIPKILSRPDAVQIVSCMFLGLSQQMMPQKKRFRIIEAVITNLELEETPNVSKSNVLNKLVPELQKLTAAQLVKISNVCIELIRDPESASKTGWKELLPKILSLLADKREVSCGGTDMTGKEYIQDIIKTLCTANLNPAVIVPMTAMFSEIIMTSDEHERVVRKMCDSFSNMLVKNLPSLVQQLLRLCKDDHSVIVFLKLRSYFSKYLHSFIDEETNREMDEKSRSEIIEAEHAIISNIEDFARISRLSDLMKLCKNASNASCLLLDPFLLSILLILSCMPAYETQVSDLLRIMITQAICEEERKKESAWLSGIIDYKSDIDQLFSLTIQSRLCENDKVVKGLMNLAFSLLSFSNPKTKESSLKKIWRVGRIILVSLIKKHRKISKTILQNLTDRIITGSISNQYTDCLLHLCNVASTTMVDHFNTVIRILEFINTMPGIVSQRIVTALIPLVQISSTLRDNLIMCLRKALFSRNIEIRQTAVLGFLQLLKFLKLQKLSTFSQNTLTQTSFQGPSVFTQICMDVHTQQTYSQQIRANTNPYVNEAICLEVIGILKRCFMQQAVVKTTLYKGLFNAISVNPELCVTVLDVLLDHFNQFYENDGQTLPPLSFDKLISVQNSEVILQEPIGRLILLIQDVLLKTNSMHSNDNEDDTPRSVQKFTEIMLSLIERFSQCDLNHFLLDETTNLFDTTPDSFKVQEKVGQILSSYEALMAYIVNSWNRDDTTQIASKLILLHRSYHLVSDFVKNSDKSSKKKDTTTVENGEKKRKSTKKERSSISKKDQFKVPPTILSLKTINRMLSLFLLDEVEWSSAEALNEIKPRRRIFNYCMHASLDAIRQMKVRLNEEQRSSAVFNDVTSLAKLLFLRCLSRYKEIAEFDGPSAIASVECFSEVITLMQLHYHSKFPQFLQETVFVSPNDGLPKQLLPILKVYKNLLTTILTPDNSDSNATTEAEDDIDPSSKMLTTVLLTALSTVVLTLPVEHETTGKILDWLIFIAEKYTFPNVNSTKTFINLLLTMQNRCRSDLTLLNTLSLQLCHIFPSINETIEEKNVRPLNMVSDQSKATVFPMLCSTLISNLDDADYMVTRFKSEHIIVSYLKDSEDGALTQCGILKRRERELCQHVLHVTLMTKNIISIAAPTGPCLESLIKVLTRNFNVLTSLTKYFTLRSSPNDLVYQNAMFHKLVKVAGSQFLRQEASDLLLYVEKDYENETKSVSQLATQAKKQYILLPKLVSELEYFSKAVMQLGKKCKDTAISNYVKLTITRDFRLNAKKVDEVFSRRNESSTEDEDESTGNASTSVTNGNTTTLGASRVSQASQRVVNGVSQTTQRRANGVSQTTQRRANGVSQTSQRRANGVSQTSQRRVNGVSQPSQKRRRVS